MNVLAGLGPTGRGGGSCPGEKLGTPALRRPAAEALASIGPAAHPASLKLLRPANETLTTPGLAEGLARPGQRPASWRSLCAASERRGLG